MGVGHAAAALASVRFAPRTNAGILIFAAFFADFLLGIFALAGLEHAQVPPNYSSVHYLTFTFPYSHGLLTLLFWGLAFGGITAAMSDKNSRQTFWICFLLVVSHYLLDGIVHVAGLPVTNESSVKFGLGLWRNMPLELSIETILSLLGVVLYLKVLGRQGPKVSRYGIPIFMAIMTALTWTMLFATSVPKSRELTANWIVAPIVLSVIPWILDRPRIQSQEGG